ncbi:MAG: hypothetical protein CBB60_004965 [Armatimonadetes bacterium Cent15-Ar3]|nr:MAG: hypothetical protein CBB60_004965 [Armatimonadetes bacterium Cent15-Ar3]
MTYDDFAAIALALPEVEEKVGRHEIDLHRNGRHIARLRDKGTTLAIRVPWELHDELLGKEGTKFFKTDHYKRYPYVLIKVEELDDSEAKSLLSVSWTVAPLPLSLR